MAAMMDLHAELAVWAIKTLIVQVPEPEIYFTPGVELSLTLTEPLPARAQRESEDAPRHLTEAERESLDDVFFFIDKGTTEIYTGRPSDLFNMMLIGTREQISSAFRAAGWSETVPVSMRSRIQVVRAAAEGRNSQSFPMTKLLLNGTEADMSWQKGLNDLSKRHHVRIWRQGTWQGQEVWIGAATRDIDFAYMHHGALMTHRIEANIDLERDKIANDLVYTSYVEMLDLQERSSIPSTCRNGKGDLMSTDTKIAIIRFRDSDRPRLSTDSDEFDAIPIHGKVAQRFVRREILSARNDIVRNNMYWRGYEGVRWIVTAIRGRNRPPEVADVAPNPRFARFVSLR